MLDIKKDWDGSALTVSLSGRLDTTTAPQLEEELKNSLDGVTDLTLDLAQLEYISSAGLRVVLSAQKIISKRGQMTVTGANGTVMEIFEVTGFADILTFA